MFFISKKKFKETVKNAVDEHLKSTGKEVIVQKTVVQHHHHSNSGSSSSVRQDGSNINGPSEALKKSWL